MSPPAIELSTGLTSFQNEAPPDWDDLFQQARLLDRAGVDRLCLSDHVVFGERLDEYGRPEVGGVRGGVQPTGPDGNWLEPLTTLAVIAGMTERIRLATSILIAALRRPVVLAKTAATLDVLSGGRLDLGVGVGWQREEYEAAGVPFDGRGKALDHTLEVLQTLWREPRATYDGMGLKFAAIHMMPKPVQPGGVPIWVSGTVNPRVVSRVARFGSGWIPWGDSAADVVAGIAQMKERLDALGHDSSRLQVVGTLRNVRGAGGTVDAEATMEAVPALAAAGVTDFRIRFQFPDDPAAAEEQVRHTVTAFRAAAG
ncbi:MAG: TIGR03619 family F420-dependent LLM class oxidoreductase, partial [Acidimicrobiaceae bacterium]|nr:TIGR03619 family F420-dependent LLM class oxidoreductase [Acidimicrobiaceae bacterium]